MGAPNDCQCGDLRGSHHMMSLFSRWFRRGQRDTGSFEIEMLANRGAPTVLILTEHINATYFISFDLPLRQLHADGKVNFAVMSQGFVTQQAKSEWPRWLAGQAPDAVVMTRYGQIDGPELMAYFQSHDVPVIYHIDDDLLALPQSLGAEINQRHGAKEVIDARHKMLSSCDLIYASTSALAGRLAERFPGQEIFHGMYAPYMGDLLNARPSESAEGLCIGYMGSKGHHHDLELAVPAIARLLDERPELRFEVFGTIKMPVDLQRFGARVSSRSVQKSYREFLQTLASLNWDVGLAPLVDAPFNQCKAPTKFIEYAACKIPVIASDVAVYGNVIPPGGGLLVAGNWYEKISQLLDDSSLRSSSVEVASTHCAKSFGLPRLQSQVMKVIAMVQAK